MRKMFGNGRYANVTATLALVVALSGTAYAAATVTSAQIVNDTIQGIDIKAETIVGSDIRNGRVGSADVTDESLTGADVADESLGAPDVTDESLTGAEVLDGALAGTDLADGTVDSVDLANPVLWATIGNLGTIEEGTDVTAVSIIAGPTYRVTFATTADIFDSCAAFATPIGDDGDSATIGSLGTSTVDVRIANQAGTLVQRDFNVMVTC